MWTWYKEGLVGWAPLTMLLSRCRCPGVKPTRHLRPPAKYTDITTSSSPSTRIISLFNLTIVPSWTCTPQTWCALHERPRSPMFVPTMSNLAPVVIDVVDGCAAIFRNYVKLRTSTESWFEGECNHIWAICCIAHESRFKIQCPQESVKNGTAWY